jgi:hypothetical protein
MVELGVPDMAEAQADDLVKRDPSNATALGVSAYMSAARGNPGAAIDKLQKAIEIAPQDPFVLRTSAQVVAWYDAQTDRSKLTDADRAGVEALRAKGNGQDVFAQAYRDATDRQRNNPPAPSNQAMTGTHENEPTTGQSQVYPPAPSVPQPVQPQAQTYTYDYTYSSPTYPVYPTYTYMSPDYGQPVYPYVVYSTPYYCRPSFFHSGGVFGSIIVDHGFHHDGFHHDFHDSHDDHFDHHNNFDQRPPHNFHSDGRDPGGSIRDRGGHSNFVAPAPAITETPRSSAVSSKDAQLAASRSQGFTSRRSEQSAPIIVERGAGKVTPAPAPRSAPAPAAQSSRSEAPARSAPAPVAPSRSSDSSSRSDSGSRSSDAGRTGGHR